MKKAQVGMDTFVALGILAIALLVLLVIVFPSFKEVLVGEGEKGACEWSLVMHSLTKLGDWSLIPAECRAHRIEIDMKYLNRFTSEARRRIRAYNKDEEKYGPILEHFKDINNEQQVYEWALNKAVAQEMLDCWTKVFKGRLPLFDQWWNMYDWGDKHPGSGKEALTFWIPLIGTQRFYGPPTNCIICSRIKFSPEVQDYFKGKEIKSFDTWLRYNYPRYGGKGYYEELAEGRSELNSLFTPPYSFNVNTPFAVLYEKIYYYQGMVKWTDYFIKQLSGGSEGTYELNFLKLVPYTEGKLIGPPDYGERGNKGGEGCTFVLD